MCKTKLNVNELEIIFYKQNEEEEEDVNVL